MPPPLATDAWLADLARRASGLQFPALARAQRLDEPAVRTRWQRWLRLGGGHDWRVLRRRMRIEGLTPGSLYQPHTLAALPAWCETLREIMQAAPDTTHDDLPPEAHTLPLTGLLAPCLVVARRRLLAAGAPPSTDVFAPEATQGLETALLRRLAQISGPCVLQAFDAQRGGAPLRGLLNTGSDGPASRVKYDAFVAASRADGLRDLLSTWPVLGRLLATCVEHWVAAGLEFRARLVQDHHALRQRFFPGQAASPVTQVLDTLSDPHGKGRTVLAVVFADGNRIVYKPRPLDMEAAFAATLAWLNPGLADAGLPTHRLADAWARAGYGWMAWVQNSPLPYDQTQAYHWRLGSLLAVYRALHGVDLHQENLIAAGAHPVLVDAECLLHPDPAALQDDVGAPAMPMHDVRRLLQTGALPFYSLDAGTRTPRNIAALARQPDAQGAMVPTFVNPDTDAVMLRRRAEAPVTAHHPRHPDGRWVDMTAHRAMLVEGYRHTLTHLVQARESLLGGQNSPWQGLRRAHGRLLARSTWNYGVLLRAAVAPDALRDGVMFELTFEPLYRELPAAAPMYRTAAAAERAALRDLDVPRLGFVADDARVRDPLGAPLPATGGHSPWATVARALRALDAPQVQRETLALDCLLRAADPAPIPGTGRQHLRRAATALHAHAADPHGPAPTWYSLQQTPSGVAGTPAGPGLYDGLGGLAIALAAAACVLNDPALACAAHAALTRPQALLAHMPVGHDPIPAGWSQGRAGCLQALDAVGHLLDDATLRQAAQRHAQAWVASPAFADSIGADRQFDLMGGSAGVLMTLLALADASGGDTALRHGARRCGEHLLRSARREGDACCWAQGRAPALSGLSHGGAGIALALARLYRATGESDYRDAALGAIIGENRLFHPQRHNWRDLRGTTGQPMAQVQACGCSWCHGAPGIALSRALLLDTLDADLTAPERQILKTDLDIGLDTLDRALQTPDSAALDDLCCGTAGLIDLALACGQILRDPGWTQRARDAAALHLDRWQSRHDAGPHYWFSKRAMTTGDISLFKGTSGWVYLQARLAAPERVACVLLPQVGR